jgi:hypothetical protein
MDDVVADWHAHAQQVLKKRWDKNGERIPQHEWDRVKDDIRFYRNLPLMEGAHEMIAMCNAYIDQNPQYHLRFQKDKPIERLKTFREAQRTPSKAFQDTVSFQLGNTYSNGII